MAAPKCLAQILGQSQIGDTKSNPNGTSGRVEIALGPESSVCLTMFNQFNRRRSFKTVP